MQYSVGVDLGSTAIKVVFVQNNTLIWHKAIPTAPGQDALANEVIEEGIRELDISKDDILGVAATGYGKNLMNSANKVIDEVSANALGLHLLSGAAAKVIINIVRQERVLFIQYLYMHIILISRRGEYTHMGISLKVTINCQFLILWLFVRLFLAFSFRRFCLSLFK